MSASIVSTVIPLRTRIQHLAMALLIFAVLYTLTNAYSAALFTSYPERIYNLATTLDSSIPFIPAMIVPYSWSMILFIASFFMVRTPKQLSVLSARLIVATLLACVIFYIFPARFSFIRPVTNDWTAFGYLFLSVTDQPFNQLPSLHVSYALLLGISLWNVLDSSANSKTLVLIYRATLALICSLIIVSTIFTYQHHLLDIVGAIVLAIVVLAISAKIKNALVIKYLSVSLTGFLLIAIGAFFVAEYMNVAALRYIGIAFGLYWLTSFLLLAWLYQLDNIDANRYWFHKNSFGKLTFSTWLRFAPLLVVYKAMAKLGQIYNQSQIRKTPALPRTAEIEWLVIKEGILTAATARLSTPLLSVSAPIDLVKTNSVTQLVIVDVAAEIDSHFQTVMFTAHKVNIDYLYLPLLDLQAFKVADLPILFKLFEQIDSLVGKHCLLQNDYHDKQIRLQSDQDNKLTLLNFHCVMGFSRSIAVQVLYLVYCDKLTINNYKAWINQHYPNAHLSEKYLSLAVVMAMQEAH